MRSLEEVTDREGRPLRTLSHAREEILLLRRHVELLEENSVPVEDAKQLTYKALFKGAAVERLAAIFRLLGANATARRLALERLYLEMTGGFAQPAINSKRALADGLNRRGWEAHLRMLRREQLTLLAENARLQQKVNLTFFHIVFRFNI